MPLQPGARLGPYDILALIGKGGMGEVYRARDTRLNRDVAIKVADGEFSERFSREARSIAALNHSNVCHLYDVGTNYLVLEYVEGESLLGPLSFDEAPLIVRQLIDGIEAAHEKNISHRDLKPANIKITPEGVVKVLDFGLAKATDPGSEILGAVLNKEPDWSHVSPRAERLLRWCLEKDLPAARGGAGRRVAARDVPAELLRRSATADSLAGRSRG